MLLVDHETRQAWRTDDGCVRALPRGAASFLWVRPLAIDEHVERYAAKVCDFASSFIRFFLLLQNGFLESIDVALIRFLGHCHATRAVGLQKVVVFDAADEKCAADKSIHDQSATSGLRRAFPNALSMSSGFAAQDHRDAQAFASERMPILIRDLHRLAARLTSARFDEFVELFEVAIK